MAYSTINDMFHNQPDVVRGSTSRASQTLVMYIPAELIYIYIYIYIYILSEQELSDFVVKIWVPDFLNLQNLSWNSIRDPLVEIIYAF